MKETYTKKLYYGKYPYRMVLANFKKIKFTNPNQIKRVIKASFPDIDNRSLISYMDTKVVINIFIKSQSDYDKLFEVFGPAVIEVEKPVSGEHTSLLEKEKDRVTTRETLFYKKYRYAMRFKTRGNKEVLSNLQSWCVEQFGAENQDETWSFPIYWATATLFLASKEDAMLAKLSATNYYLFERVVLFSELQSEPNGDSATLT